MSEQNDNLKAITAISEIKLDPIFSNTLRGEIESLGKAASKIPALIVSESVLQTAEEIIKKANAFKKRVSEIRMSFTRPLDEKKAELMTLEKSVIKPATDASDRLGKAVLAYQKMKRDKAAAEALKIQQEAQKKLNRLSNPDSIARHQQATEAALEQVAPTLSGVRSVKKFEVVDLKLVPREFLMIDEAAVKKAIANNAINISGIRIYEDLARTGK